MIGTGQTELTVLNEIRLFFLRKHSLIVTNLMNFYSSKKISFWPFLSVSTLLYGRENFWRFIPCHFYWHYSNGVFLDGVKE